MGRSYAGILGLTAFLAVMARGIVTGGSVDATLQNACIGLFLFAAVGAVIGRMAAGVVENAVRGKFAKELAARQK